MYQFDFIHFTQLVHKMGGSSKVSLVASKKYSLRKRSSGPILYSDEVLKAPFSVYADNNESVKPDYKDHDIQTAITDGNNGKVCTQDKGRSKDYYRNCHKDTHMIDESWPIYSKDGIKEEYIVDTCSTHRICFNQESWSSINRDNFQDNYRNYEGDIGSTNVVKETWSIENITYSPKSHLTHMIDESCCIENRDSDKHNHDSDCTDSSLRNNIDESLVGQDKVNSLDSNRNRFGYSSSTHVIDDVWSTSNNDSKMQDYLRHFTDVCSTHVIGKNLFATDKDISMYDSTSNKNDTSSTFGVVEDNSIDCNNLVRRYCACLNECVQIYEELMNWDKELQASGMLVSGALIYQKAREIYDSFNRSSKGYDHDHDHWKFLDGITWIEVLVKGCGFSSLLRDEYVSNENDTYSESPVLAPILRDTVKPTKLRFLDYVRVDQVVKLLTQRKPSGSSTRHDFAPEITILGEHQVSNQEDNEPLDTRIIEITLPHEDTKEDTSSSFLSYEVDDLDFTGNSKCVFALGSVPYDVHHLEELPKKTKNGHDIIYLAIEDYDNI